MASIINLYNPDGVDEALLGTTGSGGLLSEGSLKERPLESYVGSEERPVFLLSNAKSGVSCEPVDGGDAERLVPGSGYRAFCLVTDVRVLFVIGDNDDRGDRSVSVPLPDVEIVETDESVIKSLLTLTTAADRQWTFATGERDLSAVESYLETASLAWIHLERALDEARRHLVDAGQHIESRAYDAAEGALAAARTALDDARAAEADLCESGVPAMASRIERVGERVHDVRTDLLLGRATHHTDEAEAHWRATEYDAAYEAYRAAHEDYLELLRVEDPTFEGSADLREDLARVERNLASLERAPLQRAEEAREAADATDDPSARAEHLETAIERYRTALELDWGREHKRFAGDTDDIRERIDEAAAALVRTRVEQARDWRSRGDDHRAADEPGEAAFCYHAARARLEDARDVARELATGDVSAVEERLAAVEDRLSALGRARAAD